MDIHSFRSAVALLYSTHSGCLIQICETAAQTRTNQNDSSFNLKLLSIVLILHTWMWIFNMPWISTIIFPYHTCMRTDLLLELIPRRQPQHIPVPNKELIFCRQPQHRICTWLMNTTSKWRVVSLRYSTSWMVSFQRDHSIDAVEERHCVWTREERNTRKDHAFAPAVCRLVSFYVNFVYTACGGGPWRQLKFQVDMLNNVVVVLEAFELSRLSAGQDVFKSLMRRSYIRKAPTSTGSDGWESLSQGSCQSGSEQRQQMTERAQFCRGQLKPFPFSDCHAVILQSALKTLHMYLAWLSNDLLLVLFSFYASNESVESWGTVGNLLKDSPISGRDLSFGREPNKR